MQRLRFQPVSDAQRVEEQERLEACERMRGRIDDLLAAADLIDSGIATAQQQRDALVMSLRGVTHMARYLLGQYADY